MPKGPRNPSSHIRKRVTKPRPGRPVEERLQAIVTYPDPDQRDHWRQISKTFRTLKEAHAWIDRQKVEVRDDPNFRPPTSETVTAFLDDWLDARRARVRATTWRSYRYALRHVQDGLGNTSLAQLTTAQIQRFYGQLLRADCPLSQTYVHTIHVVFHMALADAVKWHRLRWNPAGDAVPPPVERADLVIPTLEETGRLLKVAETHRLFRLWLLISLTGLRHGEGVGLRWQDYNARRQQLTIRQRLTGTGARKEIGPTKSKAGYRTMPVTPFLQELLESQREHQEKDRLAAGSRWVDTGLVFTTQRGTALDPGNVRRDFKRMLARAGLPSKIRIHDLRHAMAEDWMASGEDLNVIAARLGHSDPSVTLRFYGHVRASAQVAAAARREEEWLRVNRMSTGTQPNPENREYSGETPSP